MKKQVMGILVILLILVCSVYAWSNAGSNSVRKGVKTIPEKEDEFYSPCNFEKEFCSPYEEEVIYTCDDFLKNKENVLDQFFAGYDQTDQRYLDLVQEIKECLPEINLNPSHQNVRKYIHNDLGICRSDKDFFELYCSVEKDIWKSHCDHMFEHMHSPVFNQKERKIHENEFNQKCIAVQKLFADYCPAVEYYLRNKDLVQEQKKRFMDYYNLVCLNEIK